MTSMTEEKKRRLKRRFAVICFVIVLVLSALAAWFFITRFDAIRDAESFRDFLAGYGAKAPLVALGVQVLQVFVFLIPGEAVEIGMGYAFGAVKGTLLCYAGITAASLVIFLLMKRFEPTLSALFVDGSGERVKAFIEKHIHDRTRLGRLAFILYLIPGTPKDLFTYLFALTPMRFSSFTVITSVARFPSVISSTVGGMLIHNGHILPAVCLFAATAAVSAVGWIIYEKMLRRKTKDG